MKSWLLALVIVAKLFSALPDLRAQPVESKLAALEKLPSQEHQQRLLEAAKSEGEV